MENVLKQILEELQDINKKLQAIENGDEKESILNDKLYSKLVVKQNNGEKIAEVTLSEATPAEGYQITLTPKYD